MLANGLFTLVALIAAFAIGLSVVNLPIFALKEVSVGGISSFDEEFKHVTREQINSLIRSEVVGSFFTVDLDTISNAFEKLPWVRVANVRRHWPQSLEVTLEEHIALARWGNFALVNTYGEVFNAVTDKRLPAFTGPEESSQEVARQYAVFRKILQPLQQNITQVDFSPRRAWRIHTENGIVLELGREQVEARLGLYVSAHDHVISQFKKQFTYVDLRYPNGFSVRMLEANRQHLRKPG
ncbi:MAG: cell division protein FtsQ/DivIB [Nitrosomonadaceae bacterium]